MALNKKKTITDFESQISSVSGVKIKVPADVLSQEDVDLITSTLGVAAKYKVPTWFEDMSLTEMTSDLMTLQAHQVDMMYRFGMLTSFADTAEEQLKTERSKVRMEIKSLRSQYEDAGEVVSITADDAKDLSYAKTAELNEALQERRAAADFIKSIYFSVKDHVVMLNNTIQRLSRLEMQ